MDDAAVYVKKVLKRFLLFKLNEHGGFLRAKLSWSIEMAKLARENPDTLETDLQALITFHATAPLLFVTPGTLEEVIDQWIEHIDAAVEVMIHNGSVRLSSHLTFFFLTLYT